MMTARSEYRLSLRHSNADARLTGIGRQYRLISDERWAQFTAKTQRIEHAIETLKNTTVQPDAVAEYLEQIGTTPLKQGLKLDALLRRPQVQLHDITKILSLDLDLRGEEAAEVSCRIKYEQYIARQDQQNAHFEHLEHIRLPKEIDYLAVHGLSSEAVEKLGNVRPENLAHAARISGISPADISILMTYLKAGGYHD